MASYVRGTQAGAHIVNLGQISSVFREKYGPDKRYIGMAAPTAMQVPQQRGKLTFPSENQYRSGQMDDWSGVRAAGAEIHPRTPQQTHEDLSVLCDDAGFTDVGDAGKDPFYNMMKAASDAEAQAYLGERAMMAFAEWRTYKLLNTVKSASLNVTAVNAATGSLEWDGSSADPIGHFAAMKRNMGVAFNSIIIPFDVLTYLQELEVWTQNRAGGRTTPGALDDSELAGALAKQGITNIFVCDDHDKQPLDDSVVCFMKNSDPLAPNGLRSCWYDDGRESYDSEGLYAEAWTQNRLDYATVFSNVDPVVIDPNLVGLINNTLGTT